MASAFPSDFHHLAITHAQPSCKPPGYQDFITPCLAFQRTLPDGRNPPTKIIQRFNRAAVPLLIRRDLGSPEFWPCRRPLEKVTVVTMPEAAMYKYDGSVLWKHNIGLTRQILAMESKPEPLGVQQPSDL